MLYDAEHFFDSYREDPEYSLKTVKAASDAGVKHYFVEQDQTPGDPLVSLKASFEYLEKLNY